MTIKDFSENLYCKAFDNDEMIPVGEFKMVESGLLAVFRLMIFVKNYNQMSGSEGMTLKVYNDPRLTSLYCESELILLSGIDFKQEGECYLGYVAFELPQNPVQVNDKIYPTVTIGGYTKNAEDFFIGLIYDFPLEVYQNGNDLFYKHSFNGQVYLLQNEGQ